MKYIISIILIVFIFTACNKREVVIYNPNKIIKEDKKNIINNNTDEEIKNKSALTTAIIYSSKRIGKYSVKISDIVLAYSVNSNSDFSYDFIDIDNEDYNTISSTFNNLKDKNITKVIFYLTSLNLSNLYKYPNVNDFDIYLPLVNKKESTNINHNNIIFGGIDYMEQLNTLKQIAKSNIIEIYDNQYRNIKLHEMISNDENITSYKLNGKYPNYKRFIKNHPKLNDSSIILNLSVVKSSIFLSQLRAYDDLNITEVLTTQNNFTPLLFVLTQKKDIKKLILTNSILKVDTKLYNINKLIGNNIKYDWVNYSTVLGLEYLRTKKELLFNNIKIINNQINYPVNLFSTKRNSFISYVKEQNDTINEL